MSGPQTADKLQEPWQPAGAFDLIGHAKADNGRPAVDPELLFKMLFIGYLFGIRSERQLVPEIQVNVAYRWFLGLRFTDKVADASTLSQKRRRPNHKEGYFYKREYRYDPERDGYVCPNGEFLGYHTTNRMRYREYASQASSCANCPMREQCTQSRNGAKVVTRHVWEDYKEEINAHRLSDKGKELYKRRKETVERCFADAKELHGHRYSRSRGLAKIKA